MGNFNRGGGRRSFGDRNFGSRDRQMFKAVCSNCGKDCEVPFKPTGDKPVYCSDCFEKMGDRRERRSFDRPRYNGGSSSDNKYKVQLESVNAKLDKILSLLQPKEVTEVSSPAETKFTKSKKSSKEKSPKETE